MPFPFLDAFTRNAMRATANQFMQSAIEIYNPTLAYDGYGKQIVASGTAISTSGYVGSVRGSDKELVTETMQSYVARNGVETKQLALFLLPNETPIDAASIIRTSNQDWHVIWHNNITMNEVQLYTKVIAAQFSRKDEKQW